MPLRGEDLVFAREFELQKRPARKRAPGSEFTPRIRVENRISFQFFRLARRLGFVGVSLHTLRHSCASRMVMPGVPLSAVARVTGHSTLRCAALYGKHAPQDAARMAIRALEAASAVPSASHGGDRQRTCSGEMGPHLITESTLSAAQVAGQ